jgi:hypothetical protein
LGLGYRGVIRKFLDDLFCGVFAAGYHIGEELRDSGETIDTIAEKATLPLIGLLHGRHGASSDHEYLHGLFGKYLHRQAA